MVSPGGVGHIEIVETLADAAGSQKAQPFHVRLVDAGNHEKVLWSESYAEQRSAYDAIRWLGRLFSPVERATTFDARQADGPGHAGWLHVWLDGQEFGEKIGIPIRHRTVTRAND